MLTADQLLDALLERARGVTETETVAITDALGRVLAGAPVPPGADAVRMQEYCMAEGESVVINKLPQPGENIRRAGEDIEAGGQVLAAGARIGAAEMGLAASGGGAPPPG